MQEQWEFPKLESTAWRPLLDGKLLNNLIYSAFWTLSFKIHRGLFMSEHFMFILLVFLANI